MLVSALISIYESLKLGHPTQGYERVGPVVVVALGTAQTLAWGSTYYLPAVLAAPMAREFGVSPAWIFGAFSAALVVSALLGPAAGRAIDLRGVESAVVSVGAESAPLPPQLLDALRLLVAALCDGRPVTVSPQAHMVTPHEAAELLRLSRADERA